MLGESQQTFFTVKDISAREFIEAFAQYLKKNNLIERPAWADFVKTATSNYQSTQEASLLPLMMIGFTTELPHSPARSILDLALELDFCPTSTEDSKEEDALQNIMITPAPKSSDGDFNNWRSKNTLRRIRKEMAWRSTPESSPMREEELLTVLQLSISRTENDSYELYLISLLLIF